MSATVKVRGLSPLTTDLVRRVTRLQQYVGTVEIGRTVLVFHQAQGEVLQLLDHLIATEIPGSGANSKEVKRLRDLRSRVQHPDLQGSGVTITQEKDPLREELIDLLAQFYYSTISHGHPAAERLDELMGDPFFDQAQARAWLAERL